MTENEAHQAIRNAMNAGLKDPNYFIWLRVEEVAPDQPVETIDLDRLVRETDEWLEKHDPDDPDVDDVPETEVVYETVAMKLKAAPKKKEARGHHPDRVVPAAPVITTWS